MFSVSRYQVLTVGKDKKATLWDLKGGGKGGIDVMKMSSITDLPMRGPGMCMNSVCLANFEARKEESAAWQENMNVLYMASGHKAAAAVVPPSPGSKETKVKARNFVDPLGNKVQKRKLCVRSLMLLGLRNLLLLGCEDGTVKMCV